MSDSLLRQAEQQIRSAICLMQTAIGSEQLRIGFKRHAFANAVLLQSASALRLVIGHALQELSKAGESTSNLVLNIKQWQDFGALGLRAYLSSYTKLPENTLMARLKVRFTKTDDSLNTLLFLLESLEKSAETWDSTEQQSSNLIASNAVISTKPAHWTRFELVELLQINEEFLVSIQQWRAQEEEF